MKKILTIIGLALCFAGFGQITPSYIQYASNGLTKSGNRVTFGGSVTSPTTVYSDSVNLVFNDTATNTKWGFGEFTGLLSEKNFQTYHADSGSMYTFSSFQNSGVEKQINLGCINLNNNDASYNATGKIIATGRVRASIGYSNFSNDNDVFIAIDTMGVIIDLGDTSFQNVSLPDFASSTYLYVDASGYLRKGTVPVYADDAAAVLGGLTTGQFYQTTTAGSTYVKIVP